MLLRKRYIQLIIGIIILIVSTKYWFNFFQSFSIFILATALLFLIIGLFMVIELFKDTIAGGFLFKLLGLIIGLTWILLTYIMSIILIILAVILCWSILFLLFNTIVSAILQVNFVEVREIFNLPIIYLSSLLTGIVLSYYGEFMLGILDKIFNIGPSNKNEISKEIAVSILARINLKKRTYELSIILYILSVIENLTSLSIIRLDFWLSYRAVALEVMLTFIAIDSYFNTFNIRIKGDISNNKKEFPNVLTYFVDRFSDSNKIKD